VGADEGGVKIATSRHVLVISVVSSAGGAADQSVLLMVDVAFDRRPQVLRPVA